MGIMVPTEIQEKIIPPILEGRDIIAESETGSGKTLGFAVPIVHRLQKTGFTQVIVLAPTRELAQQIGKEFEKVAENDLTVVTMYGGTGLDQQIRDAKRADIAVGTPGRVLDLIHRGSLQLGQASVVVLDEADRMLDMGFIEDLEKILAFVPAQRQTMLLSATMPHEVTGLAQKYLKNPLEFRVDADIEGRLLKQVYYLVSGPQKPKALVLLLKASAHDLALVFCRTKRGSENLTSILTRYGIKARYLNGDLPQNKRERIVDDFKDFKFNVLVATDVASRGLHIDFVTHVYNYEVPDQLENYVHRVGRTARAGKSGDAITLVTEQDFQFLRPIRSYFEGKIEPGDLNEVVKKVPDVWKEIQDAGPISAHPHSGGERGGYGRRPGGHSSHDAGPRRMGHGSRPGGPRRSEGGYGGRPAGGYGSRHNSEHSEGSHAQGGHSYGGHSQGGSYEGGRSRGYGGRSSSGHSAPHRGPQGGHRTGGLNRRPRRQSSY